MKILTAFLTFALIFFMTASYAQKCDCDKIKKISEKKDHGDITEEIEISGFPYTTFNRDEIGGSNATPSQRLIKIRDLLKNYLTVSSEDLELLYTNIYDNAQLSLSSTNCKAQADDYCVNARIAKNAAFVYMANVKPDGTTLTSTESDAFKQKAIDAIQKMEGRTDENDVLNFFANHLLYKHKFEDHFMWHTKNLVMYLQAYDYLRATSDAVGSSTDKEEIKKCGFLLQCYTRKIYKRASHRWGYYGEKDTRSLYSAGAIALASIILNDHNYRKVNYTWLPEKWYEKSNHVIFNSMWEAPVFGKALIWKRSFRMGVRPHSPANLVADSIYLRAGYAEGPFQFRLAFENLTPYFMAFKNAIPDEKIDKSFSRFGRGKVEVEFNYLDDIYMRDIYHWYNTILYPDGTAPSYDQGRNGSSFPGLAMLRDIQSFNNYTMDLDQTDFIDFSADIFASASTGFFAELQRSSNSMSDNNLYSSGDYIYRSTQNLAQLNNMHMLHMQCGYKIGGGDSLRPIIGHPVSNMTRNKNRHNQPGLGSFTIYAGRTPLIIEPGDFIAQGADRFRYDIVESTLTPGHNVMWGKAIDPTDADAVYKENYISINGELNHTRRTENRDGDLGRQFVEHQLNIIDRDISNQFGPKYEFFSVTHAIDQDLNFTGPLKSFLNYVESHPPAFGHYIHGNGNEDDTTFFFNDSNNNFRYTQGCKSDPQNGWAIAGKTIITSVNDPSRFLNPVPVLPEFSRAPYFIKRPEKSKHGTYYSNNLDNYVMPYDPTISGALFGKHNTLRLRMDSAMALQGKTTELYNYTVLQPYRCSEAAPTLKPLFTKNSIGYKHYTSENSGYRSFTNRRLEDSLDADTILNPFGYTNGSYVYSDAFNNRVSFDFDTTSWTTCAIEDSFRSITISNGSRFVFNDTVYIQADTLCPEIGYEYEKKFYFYGRVHVDTSTTVTFFLPEIPQPILSLMKEGTGLAYVYDTITQTMDVTFPEKGGYQFSMIPTNPCALACFFPRDSLYTHFEFNDGSTRRLGHIMDIKTDSGWLDITNGSKMIICQNAKCSNLDSLTLKGGIERRYTGQEQLEASYRDSEGNAYRDNFPIGSNVRKYQLLKRRSMVIVENNGALVLKAGSKTHVEGGGTIYIKPGGTLKIEAGAELFIGGENYGYGEIIADDSAFVCIDSSAIIVFHNDTLDSIEKHIFYISKNPKNPAIEGVAPGSNADTSGMCIDFCDLAVTFPTHGIDNETRGWVNIGKPEADFTIRSTFCTGNNIYAYARRSLNETRYRYLVCPYDTVAQSCVSTTDTLPMDSFDNQFGGRADVTNLADYKSFSAGTYRITLQVQNDCDDLSSMSHIIHIKAAPTASIEGDTLVCGGFDAVEVHGLNSTGDFNSVTWEAYQFVELPDYVTSLVYDSFIVRSDTLWIDSVNIDSIFHDTLFFHTKDTSDLDSVELGAFFKGFFDTTISSTDADTFKFQNYFFEPGQEYAIVLKLKNGCHTSTDTLFIQMREGPSVDAGPDKYRAATHHTVINVDPQLEGAVSNHTGSHTWTPTTGLSSTALDATATPTSTTTYVLSASDNNGCSAKDTVVVYVNSFANAGADTTICYDDSAKVGIPSQIGYTYEWFPSSAVSDDGIAEPYAYASSGSETTLIKVKVTDDLMNVEWDDVVIAKDSTIDPLFSQSGGPPYNATLSISETRVLSENLTWVFGDGSPNGSGQSAMHQYPPVPSAAYNSCVYYVNACGTVQWCDTVLFDALGNHIPTPLEPASINKEKTQYILFDVAPNPFSQQTQLHYNLDQSHSNNSIVIYGMDGRHTKTIQLKQNEGTLVLDMTRYESGLYYAQIVQDGQITARRKMVLIK